MKKPKVRQASITVEAAFAVPFFFLCMVMLICTLEIYERYAEKTIELQQKAEKAALAAGVVSSGTGRSLEDGIIDMPGVVRFQPPVFAFKAPAIRTLCRGRVRAWIGYHGSGGQDAEEGDHLVYVTDYESVYHTSSECTHLDLSWEAVTAADASHRHNTYGKRYHACEKCIGNGAANNIVYLSPQGDSYHNAASCSGLTRHVHLVKESETSGLHMCSRCAAREQKKAAA